MNKFNLEEELSARDIVDCSLMDGKPIQILSKFIKMYAYSEHYAEPHV
jgi:hypothetical protein